MFQLKAKLFDNQRVKDNYFRLLLRAPQIAELAQPGQFVQVKIGDGCQPLLRRPFSIHRISQGSPRHHVTTSPNYELIEILYEVLGQGTQLLAQKKAGEYLDIIGPLGNGFNYRATGDGRRATVLVAGGMGVAPLLFLADRIVTTLPLRLRSGQARHHVTRKTVVLLGAKTYRQILCEKDFKALGCAVKIATDDGSRGFKGKVTELLKNILVTSHKSQVTSQAYASCDIKYATIYACGPYPMLKAVSNIAKHYDITAQVSLEAHVACGIGACLGCVVNTRGGYQRVCKEGPIFNAEKIVW
ncbi:MAG: dihydroorotate dehydrogenase electron transfer subunit [Candidatus Omnitrophica bacterium]|nr:dihydroorotate dehydrogenase electron transfer subunit [Candidatus Omnitrophota bacterium]